MLVKLTYKLVFDSDNRAVLKIYVDGAFRDEIYLPIVGVSVAQRALLISWCEQLNKE